MAITACDTLHAKSAKLAGPGLLSFHRTEHQGLAAAAKPLLATSIGILLLGLGIADYQGNEFSVYRETTANDYRISIAHKRYRPADIELSLQGLAPDSYRFDKTTLHFDSVGRQELALHIDPNISDGLHRFRVIATANDGWSDTFTLTHLGSGGG